MSYGHDSGKRRRFAVIGISSFLLVAMVVAVTVGVGLKKDGGGDVSDSSRTSQVSTSMKAVQAICQPTDYRKTCEESLHKSAGNTTDPKELIQAAFKVAEKHINEAAKKSSLWQELEKDPRTRDAFQSCKELMNMSISELKHSVQKVSDFDFSMLDDIVADLKTWIGATITYQETCLDGFQNASTNAGKKMKEALKTSMELSSNSLDIVTSLSSLLTSFGFPGVTGTNRRLLQATDDNDLTSLSSLLTSFGFPGDTGTNRRLLQATDDNDLPVLGHGEQFPSWVEFETRKLLTVPSKPKADMVVAKDGSGDFSTIKEALKHIPPRRGNKPFVLYIKQGIYQEYVQFDKIHSNLVVIGDGPDKTRITGNKSFVDGINTFHTATVVVLGDNFVAKNIGFENSAGAIKHQAVALRVSADFALFYNCAMDGYQDTLYAHSKRQFYRDCTISGTIDFVFGDAIAVFQSCKFLVRKPLENQQNIVTAQGRKQRREASGFIIQNGTITAHPELVPEKKLFKSFLGRPWKEFSRTIIMESFIDDIIQPEGWLPWMGTFGLKTCWYTEFNNYGPGSDKKARVKWNGIKTINGQHALDFTLTRFLKGDTWIKAAGVPYTPNLIRKA